MTRKRVVSVGSSAAAVSGSRGARSREGRSRARSRPWGRYALVAAALLALVAAYQALPVQSWAAAYRAWLDGLGWMGWIAFTLIYAVATTALVPGAILTLAGGLAFGLRAFPLVVVGATAGAAASFLAARHLCRDKVRAMMADRPGLRAVDGAMREGDWKVVALLRLSPALPFSLQNWFLGTTSVRFWPQLWATFFGIMPGTLLYVWIGSVGGMAASGGASRATTVLLGVGVLATFAVTVAITRRAKAKLAERARRQAAT